MFHRNLFVSKQTFILIQNHVVAYYTAIITFILSLFLDLNLRSNYLENQVVGKVNLGYEEKLC